MNTRQAAKDIPVPGKPTIALDAPPEANKTEAPNTAKIAKVFLLCVELLKINTSIGGIFFQHIASEMKKTQRDC